MKTKEEILEYLKSRKAELKEKYGITTLGLYGSYARDEATENSDIDLFYEKYIQFEIQSGLEFLRISDNLAKDLKVQKVDFVRLEYMNPIIKYYARKDFIYV
ncbi:MAG: nucleotidyltransferase family protein [Candidatus Melainabacteria bacterium]|jgi:predicted nucleotidyltransferase